MKAIKTKFVPATNYRGSRVSASDENGNRIIISWDHRLDALDNHRSAAQMLCNKMNWDNAFITGSLRHCYVHVMISKR